MQVESEQVSILVDHPSIASVEVAMVVGVAIPTHAPLTECTEGSRAFLQIARSGLRSESSGLRCNARPISRPRIREHPRTDEVL